MSGNNAMHTKDNCITETHQNPVITLDTKEGGIGCYFSEDEERYFKEYVETNDMSYKNKLFNEKLYPAFSKMVESIIRRYGLFTPDEDFEETFNDAMSYMLTKVNNFDFSKGKKAYSYCGTVCKNYLMAKRQKTMTNRNRVLSYENIYDESNPDEREVDTETAELISFNQGMIDRILSIIVDMVENREKYLLSDNEVKVGKTLIYMLQNTPSFFRVVETRKFNKSVVLYFIKENTLMKTKDIREAMRKYKLIYSFAKEEYVKKEKR